MFLVQGNWKLFLLYGSISIGLLLAFNFGVFGGASHPTKPALSPQKQRAHEQGLQANDLNRCLRAAEQSVRRVRACHRRYY